MVWKRTPARAKIALQILFNQPKNLQDCNISGASIFGWHDSNFWFTPARPTSYDTRVYNGRAPHRLVTDRQELPMTRMDRQMVEHPHQTWKPARNLYKQANHTPLYQCLVPSRRGTWLGGITPGRGEGSVTVSRTTSRQTERIWVSFVTDIFGSSVQSRLCLPYQRQLIFHSDFKIINCMVY